jgi:CRP/FNR family transcriptional regulator, cyclic AMP receptor protein
MVLEPRVAMPGTSTPGNLVSGSLPLDQLRQVPIFSCLGDDALQQLSALIVSREYDAPCPLFSTGDKGDAMYLIESGRVRISVTDADGHEVTLSELHDGEFFGEMALIDGQERSAGATVLEDTRLAMLTREDFIAFITQDQKAMLAMLKEMARRLRRTDNLLRHRVSRNVNTEDAAHTTMADRAADIIASFGGSWKFIGISLLMLLIWMVANAWFLSTHTFDPYPFVFLNLVLAMVTSLQAPIIMMSQNRQAQKDRLRADLDYEVNLKNELLLTEIRNRLHEEQRTLRELKPRGRADG